MASGTVFAIASTFSADGAAGVVSAPSSDLLEHPDTARAPVTAKIAAMRQIFPRRISHPPNTVASTFCIGQ